MQVTSIVSRIIGSLRRGRRGSFVSTDLYPDSSVYLQHIYTILLSDLPLIIVSLAFGRQGCHLTTPIQFAIGLVNITYLIYASSVSSEVRGCVICRETISICCTGSPIAVQFKQNGPLSRTYLCRVAHY